MIFDDILNGKFYEKHKEIIKRIILGIIVISLFYNSYLFQYIPIKLFNLETKYYSQSLSVILNCFSNFILVFILYLIYRKDLKKEFKKFKDNFSDNFNIGLSCWFVGLLIMFISNYLISFVLHGGGAQNEKAVQSMIETIPFLMFVNASFLAPFTEEITFRKTLKDVFKNPIIFVILSFLFFGGAHVLSSAKTIVDLLYIIPYGALGGAFAYAYYKTDTVFTSMFLHMLHNGILVILSVILMNLM